MIFTVIGRIFSVEEFSVYDGPGIRTTVFLKGCPLRCTWCHNPEGQETQTTIVRSPNGCIGCNNCIRTAEKSGDRIVFTDESIKNCPMNLLRKCGREITCDELCKKLMKNEVFLKKGGVTFSGGEPLAQSDFLLSCLKQLKGKIHTAVQTSGFCDEAVFESVLAQADYFLYDLKILDPTRHKTYTGVSNEPILHNFRLLAASGKEFVVRIPLIPRVTDTEENLTAIAMLLRDNGVRYAELLPYNKMAGGKYKMLLREYTPQFDTKIPPEPRKNLFDSFGIRTKIL